MWIESVTAWFGALKLPGKVIFGLFLFCAALLVLDVFGIVPLSLLPFGQTIVLVVMLLFGFLSLAAAGGEGYEVWKHHRAETKIRARQQAKRDEREQARAEFKAKVLKRLDYLSRDEHRILADCLRKNEQSFEGWVHGSPAQNLMAAYLVNTPGGTAHGDAAVVCNEDGDCWRTGERLTYPPEARVTIYDDDYAIGPKYRMRDVGKGRGYYRGGVWIGF